jgi:hypothetical protein
VLVRACRLKVEHVACHAEKIFWKSGWIRFGLWSAQTCLRFSFASSLHEGKAQTESAHSKGVREMAMLVLVGLTVWAVAELLSNDQT